MKRQRPASAWRQRRSAWKMKRSLSIATSPGGIAVSPALCVSPPRRLSPIVSSRGTSRCSGSNIRALSSSWPSTTASSAFHAAKRTSRCGPFDRKRETFGAASSPMSPGPFTAPGIVSKPLTACSPPRTNLADYGVIGWEETAVGIRAADWLNRTGGNGVVRLPDKQSGQPDGGSKGGHRPGTAALLSRRSRPRFGTSAGGPGVRPGWGIVDRDPPRFESNGSRARILRHCRRSHCE